MIATIRVFLGEATDVEARVYAEYYAPADEGSAHDPRRVTLAGRLIGPRCAYTRTLPAEFAFRELGRGPTVLAEAVVPDPCSWSPVLPHLYDVELEARREENTIARYEAVFGIRRQSTRGSSLILDGKRWVVRAAGESAVGQTDLAAWREQRLSMLAFDPDEALCENTSRAGVPLIAELPADDMAEALERLARWPSVGIVVLPVEWEGTGSGAPPLPRNVLAAQRFAANKPARPADWARVVVCDVNDGNEAAERLADCGRPVIGVRSGDGYSTCAAARTACDRLQRDLAPRLQLAGYVV